MLRSNTFLGVFCILGSLATACTPAPTSPAAAPPSPRLTPSVSAANAPSKPTPLEMVALIHGGAGPWAVSGYRMGEFALTRLDVKRGSFDLDVIHHSPKNVQYSCVADGAAAATGASLGKLNLSLVDADAANVKTTYRNKATGQSITLKPSAAFVARYKDVPRERLADAGKEVIALPDDQVFEIVP